MVATRQKNGITNGAHALHNQEVHTVRFSEEDRVSGQLSPEQLAEAITYLHRDGIIILENAIDPSHLDDLEALLGPEAGHEEYGPSAVSISLGITHYLKR